MSRRATTRSLVFGGQVETDEHVDEDGDQVVAEGDPVGDLEGGHESSHQHEEDSAGADDGAEHQHDLVADVRHADVVVHPDGLFVVADEVENICDCRGHPAPEGRNHVTL